ncbi:MAG TPA: acetyl-CoA hydrolase/transferase C-terminal domain-containing protein [Smithellaceae bacterium]|nr:acetyl-CoA hydrolase/transferase C-terminal domain-containing protein [Smithellaceae bacterium]
MMFEQEYQNKLTTPEKAVSSIPDNGLLAHGNLQAEPPALLKAIENRLRSRDLKKLRVFHLGTSVYASKTILSPEMADCVEAYPCFVLTKERGLVYGGISQFIPNYFHQLGRLIEEYMDEFDATVTTVSPMDKAGYFSFGTSVDVTPVFWKRSKLRIVEVNENMPRVFGGALLHISDVDKIVENHQPLWESPPGKPDATDEAIGKTVAEMVPDGATIQLGFGSLPNAVATQLLHHKDLGIHTEAFSPVMVKLVKQGVINGKKKTLHPGKHVYSFALGDNEMLEFMNDNPAVEGYSLSYTNDPEIIARNEKMISINATLQVDLSGQCNSEYLKGAQFSATGGQLDFVRGAFNSKGGKSILTFRSTARNNTVSRIVPRLDAGAIVTTPRMDTHWLVTEYGAVNLKGKCMRDRALAIISIAHPDFRDRLMREAEKMRLF